MKQIDLFGGGRMVGKLSYFRPHEGFFRPHSHSYTAEKRHSVGRKEPICAHHTTRRTSLIFILAIAFTLSSCQPPAGGPIEGTFWKLAYMNGEIPEGVEISAVFQGGKATGKGACNRYFADYEIDGGKLKIGPVGATKMMCGENAMLESQYFGILPKAQTFSVKGGELSIQCEGAKLRFVKGEEGGE